MRNRGDRHDKVREPLNKKSPDKIGALQQCLDY